MCKVVNNKNLSKCDFTMKQNQLHLIPHTFCKGNNSWFVAEEYEKILLLRRIHHFKSDLINNMDHMRISGTEPSPVILSQTE